MRNLLIEMFNETTIPDFITLHKKVGELIGAESPQTGTIFFRDTLLQRLKSRNGISMNNTYGNIDLTMIDQTVLTAVNTIQSFQGDAVVSNKAPQNIADLIPILKGPIDLRAPNNPPIPALDDEDAYLTTDQIAARASIYDRNKNWKPQSGPSLLGALGSASKGDYQANHGALFQNLLSIPKKNPPIETLVQPHKPQTMVPGIGGGAQKYSMAHVFEEVDRENQTNKNIFNLWAQKFKDN